MASRMERSLLNKGNDFVDEDLQYCQPCLVEGNTIQAKSFCVDCNIFLCQKCIGHHKALPVTKDHVQVKADEARKAKVIASKDKCSKKCSKHKDKRVNYFCEAHSHLGCTICFTLDHKLCRNVEHIPTAADNLKAHTGFKNFDESIKDLDTAYKTSIADIQNSLKILKADELQVQQAFKDFRKQMNDALNKLESQITTEAKKIKDNETKKLDALLKKLEKSQTSVDMLTKELRLLLSNGKNCDAYVMAKVEIQKLTRLQEDLARETGGQNFQRFKFEPNVDLLKTGALGKLITETGGPVSRWSAPSSKSPPKLQAATPSQAAVSAPTTVTKGDAYWLDMAKRMKKGDRVRRGRDWCDGDKDGGPGALGTVTVKDKRFVFDDEYVYEVQWDSGRTARHFMSPCTVIDKRVVGYGGEYVYEVQWDSGRTARHYMRPRTVIDKRVYDDECVCEVQWDNGRTTQHFMGPWSYQLEIV